MVTNNWTAVIEVMLIDDVLNGLYCDNYRFLVISIVIDCDRGNCYEHLKKN